METKQTRPPIIADADPLDAIEGRLGGRSGIRHPVLADRIVATRRRA